MTPRGPPRDAQGARPSGAGARGRGSRAPRSSPAASSAASAGPRGGSPPGWSRGAPQSPSSRQGRRNAGQWRAFRGCHRARSLAPVRGARSRRPLRPRGAPTAAGRRTATREGGRWRCRERCRACPTRGVGSPLGRRARPATRSAASRAPAGVNGRGGGGAQWRGGVQPSGLEAFSKAPGRPDSRLSGTAKLVCPTLNNLNRARGAGCKSRLSPQCHGLQAAVIVW